MAPPGEKFVSIKYDPFAICPFSLNSQLLTMWDLFKRKEEAAVNITEKTATFHSMKTSNVCRNPNFLIRNKAKLK
jgi:hypothetical protein